jgi:hypothetical protein
MSMRAQTLTGAQRLRRVARVGPHPRIGVAFRDVRRYAARFPSDVEQDCPAIKGCRGRLFVADT